MESSIGGNTYLHDAQSCRWLVIGLAQSLSIHGCWMVGFLLPSFQISVHVSN